MEIKCGDFVIAGTKFSLRDRGLTVADLNALRKGATCTLEREPRNEYDKNAIIITNNGKHLGYMPATIAKHFAPMIDEGLSLFAEVVAVNTTTKLIKVELVWDNEVRDYDADEE